MPLLDTRPGDQIKASTGCDDEDDALLPLPHLTPRSLLGATDPERDSYGQLLAVQIASIISNRNPEESRILLLGLGLDKLALDDDGLLDMLQLIGQSLP